MGSKNINITLDYNSGDGYITYHIDITADCEEEISVIGSVNQSQYTHPNKYVRNTIDISIIDRIIGMATQNGFFNKPYQKYDSDILDGSDYELAIQIGNKKRKVRDYANSAPEYVQLIERLIEDSCISEIVVVHRKPTKCPKCSSKKILDIIYGEPSTELWAIYEAGEVICGGCCISEFDPDWCCAECGTEFRKEQSNDR